MCNVARGNGDKTRYSSQHAHRVKKKHKWPRYGVYFWPSQAKSFSSYLDRFLRIASGKTITRRLRGPHPTGEGGGISDISQFFLMLDKLSNFSSRSIAWWIGLQL